MPINPRRLTQRVISRIRQSEYRLTVYYPVAKTTPQAGGVSSLPVSPLMAKPVTPPVLPDEPERVNPDVTVPCLFLEVALTGDYRQKRLEASLGGWTMETTAVARVVGSDVENQTGGTIFDGCEFVEVLGRRFRVLNVIRETPSMSTLATYYVLLTGAVKS
jgi:hypothetical protein